MLQTPSKLKDVNYICHTGEEAKKLFDEAQRMLKDVLNQKLFRATGIVGLYPACSVDDDIHVYKEDTVPRQGEPDFVFYGLRQQVSETCH